MNDQHSGNQHSGNDETTDGLVARLERLGDQPVDVSAQRLDALEARVRASVDRNESDEHRSAVAVLATGTPTGKTRSSSPWSRIALVAASIAVLVALSVAALGTRDDTLIVAAADDVTVLLPDGDSIMATDGTELPEDSVLEVSGFVDVGGRRYGPGRYRVDDGRLVLIPYDAPEVVSTDAESIEETVPVETTAGDRDVPDDERPLPTSPNTATRPTASSTTTTIGPPATRPATTTPPSTTVPDRAVPQRPPPNPTTTGPADTRPPATDPTQTRPAATSTTTNSTTSTTTTTTATTTTSITTTTVVRGRPATEEPVRAP